MAADRMRRSFVLGVASLLVGLAAPAARAAVPEFVTRSAWFEVRTAHFTVFTSDADRATAIARRLERLAELLGRIQPGLRPYPAVPVHVYLFQDQAQMAAYRYGAAENLEAFFVPGDGRFFLVVYGDGEAPGGISSLFHEYVHAHLAANLPNVPLWVNEGLAQYFSFMRLGREFIEFGLIPQFAADFMRVYFAKEPLLSVEILFAMNTRSGAYRNPNPNQMRLYIQSWVLTHQFLSGSAEDRARYERFLQKMRAGTRPRVAFGEEFPEERWPKLLEGLRGHVEESRLAAPRRLNFGKLEAAEARVIPLSPATVLYRLGELAATLGSSGSAADHFRAALALDSTRADVRAALGFVHLLAGETASATQAVERALAGDPRSTDAWVYAGQAALHTFMRQREEATVRNADPLLLEARRRFARALEREPANLIALAGYGRSHLSEPRPDSAAVAGLERAVDAMPYRPDLATDLALLKARMGQASAARELVRQRVDPSATPGHARHVSRAVEAADLERADEWRRAGREAEADSLLEHVARAAADPVIADAARGRLTTRRENKAVDHFNDGVDAANRAAYNDAARLFERAAATTADPDRKTQATAEADSMRANANAQRTLDETAALIRAEKFHDARARIAAAIATPVSAAMRLHLERNLARLDAALARPKK